MWGNLKEGLKYLAIPNSSELRDQLVGPEYDYNLKGELQLEKKSDMKRRGLQSPDIADALALTYARNVFPRDDLDWTNGGSNNVQWDYNPFDDAHMKDQPVQPRYYAPGWARLKDDNDYPYREGE